GAALRMRLAGANPQPRVEGATVLPGKVHYYRGSDPARWRTNVPTYARVRVRDVYPGTDLVYYGAGGQVEYDLVLRPGASPERLRMNFSGGEHARLNPAGDLVLWDGAQE